MIWIRKRKSSGNVPLAHGYVGRFKFQGHQYFVSVLMPFNLIPRLGVFLYRKTMQFGQWMKGE